MDPITGLSLGRIAIGATSLASPDLGVRLFGLDGKGNAQLPYMTRMFASREIALGLVTLAAPKKARKRLVTMGIAVDGADAYAGFAALQSGSVSSRTAAMLIAPAVGAVLAGLAGLRPQGKVEEPAAVTA